MVDGPGVTVRRRQLAIQLRALRRKAGLTAEQVATALDCSPAKISNIETGKGPVRTLDLEAMLKLYQVDEEERDVLRDLARKARQKGWWQSYRDALPPRFDTYLGLEEDATAISAYTTHIVHGLLETEDYARAFIRAVRLDAEPETVERLVQLRLARQHRLTGDSPLRLWVIFEEVILHRPVGGSDVMRAQLEHLVEMSDRQNVTIQVAPTACGAHAGMDGPFTVFSFGPNSGGDAVYAGGPGGNIYLDQPDEVTGAILRFDHLRASALSVEESRTAIHDAAREMT